MTTTVQPVTADEVEDFLARHLDAMAKERDEREINSMFTHAMDVSFKKWCDDQWASENGFGLFQPQRTYQF